MSFAFFSTLCLVYWIALIPLTLIDYSIRYPGKQKRVSIGGYLLMVPIVIGLAFALNMISDSLGYWIVGVLHLLYLCYGVSSTIMVRFSRTGHGT